MSRHAMLASLGLAALIASACGGSASPITWAEASPEQREAALIAATRWDGRVAGAAFDSMLVGNELDPSCPVKTEPSERSLVLDAGSGGCLNAGSGATYRGRIELSETGDSQGIHGGEARFIGVSIDDGSERLALDGTLEVSQLVDLQLYSRMHLTSELDGITLRLDLEVNCDADELCQSTADSTGSIPGLGEFAIEIVDFPVNSDPVETIVLRGTDTLRMAIPQTSGRCYPYTLDGQPAGEACS